MPDVNFNIKYARNTYEARTARSSTLWPIVGYRAANHINIIKAHNKAIYLWRDRLLSLKTLGWPDLQPTMALQFARNCPPCGVYTDVNNSCRPCKMPNICPWCHMRVVQRVYQSVERLLPTTLVEVIGNMHMETSTTGEFMDSHLEVWHKIPKRILRRLKNAKSSALQPRGAFQTTSLAPTVKCQPSPSWSLSYGLLMLVDENWAIPDWLNNGYRKVQMSHITAKKDLVNVVGRVCRYPVGLLRGDPLMTMISLNARKHKRCSEFTGCLRQNEDFNECNELE